MEISNGAYIIRNIRSRTVVDLENGSVVDGARVQGYGDMRNTTLTFNQIWLITRVPGPNLHYTLVNARSGTFLDLDGGNRADGTKVQGFRDLRQYEQYRDNQRWYFEGNNRGGYYIVNVASQTVLDLDEGGSANGTRIQGYRRQYNHPYKTNQTWLLERRSRSPNEIEALLKASPFIGRNFQHYISDGIYLTLPIEVIRYIWSYRSIGTRVWRKESFDCDDFAFVMKASVSDWCQSNIRAPVAICFGIFYGMNPATRAGHAFNWHVDHGSLQSIIMFEPQNARSSGNTQYPAYFGIY